MIPYSPRKFVYSADDLVEYVPVQSILYTNTDTIAVEIFSIKKCSSEEPV
jgi:hypothetical protein